MKFHDNIDALKQDVYNSEFEGVLEDAYVKEEVDSLIKEYEFVIKNIHAEYLRQCGVNKEETS